MILDQDGEDSPKKQVARKSGGGRSQMQHLYDLRQLQKKEKARLAELQKKRKEEARKVLPVQTGLRSQGAPPQEVSSSDNDSSHESDIQEIAPAPVSMRLRSQGPVSTNQDEATEKNKKMAENVDSTKRNANRMDLRSGTKINTSQVTDTAPPAKKQKKAQKPGKLVVTLH